MAHTARCAAGSPARFDPETLLKIEEKDGRYLASLVIGINCTG
jgi:hypothetical protein